MQTKTLSDIVIHLQHQLRSITQVITHVGNDVEQGKYSSTASGSVKLYIHYDNQYNSSKGCFILPQRHCSAIVIVPIFVTARHWKQLPFPSTEEWVKQMWYIYRTDYYPYIKKNKIMKLAVTLIDRPEERPS